MEKSLFELLNAIAGDIGEKFAEAKEEAAASLAEEICGMYNEPFPATYKPEYADGGATPMLTEKYGIQFRLLEGSETGLVKSCVLIATKGDLEEYIAGRKVTLDMGNERISIGTLKLKSGTWDELVQLIREREA